MNDYTRKDFNRAWNYADSLRKQYVRGQGPKARAEIEEELKLLCNGKNLRHPGIKLSRLEFALDEIRASWPTCDAIADCRGSEADPFGKAEAYGRKLEQRWINARTLKERASIEKEVDLLSHGLHPKFPGVEIEELLPDELTCDRAYKAHDGAYTMNTSELFDDDGEAVDMIMEALKDLARRCDALDKPPRFRAQTNGPAMTPRALNPEQAYQAAMTAYQMSQAKVNQRKAHEAMPNVVPQHPDDAQDDLEEQQQNTLPHHEGTDPLPTHDARNARGMLARHQQRLTFADGKQLHGNMKQNTEDAAARAMRSHETELMAPMRKQISEGLKQ